MGDIGGAAEPARHRHWMTCGAAGTYLEISTFSRSVPCRIDARQTMRFALVGTTLHGPFFYHGFRWLDSSMGTAKTLQKVILRGALLPCSIAALAGNTMAPWAGCIETRATQAVAGCLARYRCSRISWHQWHAAAPGLGKGEAEGSASGQAGVETAAGKPVAGASNTSAAPYASLCV